MQYESNRLGTWQIYYFQPEIPSGPQVNAGHTNTQRDRHSLLKRKRGIKREGVRRTMWLHRDTSNGHSNETQDEACDKLSHDRHRLSFVRTKYLIQGGEGGKFSKTGLCSFSGIKIYPTKGRRFVRLDSKSFTFLDRKSEAAFQRKVNPRNVRWTQVYRRLHKKGTAEEVAKKKTRRTQKVQRAIVGASLEVIKQKRNQKPEVRAASREAALREVKERNKAAATKRAAARGAVASASGKSASTKSASTKPAQMKGAGKR
ncbi:hypothetical protein PROFUN_05888 [Planoprotostelium fungivorum]|uniref:Large ribosomal subunit protein eL24-related N-terminal domain-containing protein n=1 Tax=Planoprotostelium fungivorum TaxID=1890364 RepID=A0A2P6NKT0_9EUKA|nr:hypothetical protein PROFUN_05888 [Planoprotostelium fungivorum]